MDRPTLWWTAKLVRFLLNKKELRPLWMLSAKTSTKIEQFKKKKISAASCKTSDGSPVSLATYI